MPKKKLAALASILFIAVACPPVQAQHVYKCVKDGKTSFQGVPCEAGSAAAPQPNASSPQLPWEGLRTGTSASDVRRMMPGAVTQPRGAGVRLRRQDITIAGIAFSAEYDFDSDQRLESVRITKAGELRDENAMSVSTNQANLADYDKLAAVMRARYGNKIGNTVENGEAGASRLAVETQWEVEGGKVSLNITPRTATTSILSFEFRPGASGYRPPEEPAARPRPTLPVRPAPAPPSRIRRN